MSVDAANDLMDRLRTACQSGVREWDLNTAEIVGALEMIKNEVLMDNREEDDE